MSMNKINNLGLEMLEYKEEYHKDHSSIIIDSLALSLDQMVSTSIIDRQTVDLIKNKDIDIEAFKKFLLESEKYAKTEEEIREEMEETRKVLNEALEENNLEELSTKIIIENESFLITKTLGFNEDFVVKFFGVDDKKELGKLMERKGFVEKFAALRMTQVAKEISEIFEEDYGIKLITYLPYYNDEHDGFNVDFNYEIKTKDIEENIDKIIEDSNKLNSESEELFNKKMQII